MQVLTQVAVDACWIAIKGTQFVMSPHSAVSPEAENVRMTMSGVPEEDSSLSSLLTSQSKLLENWVQLFRFPRINAAAGREESVHEANFILNYTYTAIVFMLGWIL